MPATRLTWGSAEPLALLTLSSVEPYGFLTLSSRVSHFLLTLSSAERVSKGQALQAETALRYAPASGLDYSG